MKSSLIKWGTVLLGVWTATALARGTKESRHLFLPIAGYQVMQGEQSGLSYFAALHVQLLDSTVTQAGTVSSERSTRSPLFGLTYRYQPPSRWFGEATFGVIHDEAEMNYSLEFPVYGYITRLTGTVQRSNTVMMSVDGGWKLQQPWNWLDLAGRAGFGLAWRSVRFKPPGPQQGGTLTVDAVIRDPERMYQARLGADFTLWKGDQLLLNGAVYYCRFYPFGKDVDPFLPGGANPKPFGGMGWRFTFFPIWKA